MTRSSHRSMPMTKLLLVLVAVVMTACASAQTTSPAPTPQVTPTDGCCAKCIGKTTDLPYTYDPVIHSECSAAKGVCCYNCGQDASSQMNVENAVFGDDGVTPQVKAGEWAQIQWTSVARVTYETYRTTQKKTTTVRNGSLEARLGDDKKFYICAKTQGSIYARGWGSDPCLSATKENMIEVIAGKDVDSCGRLPTSATASSTTSAPSSSSSGSSAAHKTPATSNTNALTKNENEDEETCNTQRAAIIVKPDGTKECVCAAEWTGPPSCSGFPWWKIAATIGGAVAAALSIVVSVKAYLNTRSANRATENDEVVLGSDSVPIVCGPLDRKSTTPRRPSHEGYEQHGRNSESPPPPPPQQPQQQQRPKASSSGARASQAREFSL